MRSYLCGMEQEINKILKCIDEISEKGLKSKFSEEFQKSVVKQAKVVAEYLGITSERQSIWFAIQFKSLIFNNNVMVKILR